VEGEMTWSKLSWEQRALRIVLALAPLFLVAFFVFRAAIKADPNQMPFEQRIHLVGRGLTKMFVFTTFIVFFVSCFIQLASTKFNTLPIIVDASFPKPRIRWWMKAIFATVGLIVLSTLLGLVGWLEPIVNHLNETYPDKSNRQRGSEAHEAGYRLGRVFGWGLLAIWIYYGIPILMNWRRPRVVKDDVAVFD
jgi:hypothetical protein